MIEAICAHIHNYFTDDTQPVSGQWSIEGGTLDLSGLVIAGQYFRIMGSVLNDGVYQYPPEGLNDETFDGTIWPMKVPPAVAKLAEEIGEWQQQYGAVMASPYNSENVIGVYSYSKGYGGSANNAGGADAWQSVFRARLNPWRKLR